MTSAIDYWNLGLNTLTAIISIAALVVITWNAIMNYHQRQFITGTNPVFEFTTQPVKGFANWMNVTVVVRNRSPSTIQIVQAKVARWSRARLTPLTRDSIELELDPNAARREITLDYSVLPVGKSTEMFGRPWQSDSTSFNFLVYSTRSNHCRISITWRSTSSSRWKTSVISLIMLN